MAESRISTHVLDIAQGRPAQGMPVTLEGQGLAGIWKLLGKSRTDADGRSNDSLSGKAATSGPESTVSHLTSRPIFAHST
jgi:5-hydroxyisourate hydrolase